MLYKKFCIIQFVFCCLINFNQKCYSQNIELLKVQKARNALCNWNEGFYKIIVRIKDLSGTDTSIYSGSCSFKKIYINDSVPCYTYLLECSKYLSYYFDGKKLYKINSSDSVITSFDFHFLNLNYLDGDMNSFLLYPYLFNASRDFNIPFYQLNFDSVKILGRSDSNNFDITYFSKISPVYKTTYSIDFDKNNFVPIDYRKNVVTKNGEYYEESTIYSLKSKDFHFYYNIDSLINNSNFSYAQNSSTNICYPKSEDKIPDWRGVTINGDSIYSNQYTDSKMIYYVFSHSNIPYENAIVAIDSFYKKNIKSGLKIIGIDADDSNHDLLIYFLNRNKIEWPVLVNNKTIINHLSIKDYPTIIISGNDKNILFRTKGYGKNSFIRWQSALDRIPK